MSEIVIDVRGLAPPEPFERVLTALEMLKSGDRLKLLIDVEPRPLYAMLDRNALGHHTEPGTLSGYEVTIWPEEAGSSAA